MTARRMMTGSLIVLIRCVGSVYTERHVLICYVQLEEPKVVYVDNPKGWKLTAKGEDGDHLEVVLSIVGIITQKDLPPILFPV